MAPLNNNNSSSPARSHSQASFHENLKDAHAFNVASDDNDDDINRNNVDNDDDDDDNITNLTGFTDM